MSFLSFFFLVWQNLPEVAILALLVLRRIQLVVPTSTSRVTSRSRSRATSVTDGASIRSFKVRAAGLLSVSVSVSVSIPWSAPLCSFSSEMHRQSIVRPVRLVSKEVSTPVSASASTSNATSPTSWLCVTGTADPTVGSEG